MAPFLQDTVVEQVSIPSIRSSKSIGLKLNTDAIRYQKLNKNRDSALGQSLNKVSWPSSFDGPSIWSGHMYDHSAELYTYTLTDIHISEVKSALCYFKGLELDGSQVNRQTFPLPTLSSQLEDLTNDVFNGRGFSVLRGLDPHEFSVEDNLLIFLGISSYIASERGIQDDTGVMLGHIQDAKQMTSLQDDRPIRDSRLKSHFHTDSFCDVIALQTHGCAARGGGQLITSAGAIYNEIMAYRPDIIHLLASPTWGFDTRGRLAQSRPRSLIYLHESRLIMNFIRESLIALPGVERKANVPELSLEQLAALDVVEKTAQKHQLVLQPHVGDLTFINNFALLHGRQAFEDDTASERYLMRLWLKNNDLAWSLPTELREGNEKIFAHKDVVERWNVLPQARVSFTIRERMTP